MTGTPVNYTYDTCQIAPCPDSLSTGRLTLVSDAAGTHKYKYDSRGRNVKEQHTIDGATYEIVRGYDAMNREVSTTYPGTSPETVTTTFDSQGLAETIAGSSTYLANSSYNAAGSPTQLELGNGLKANYDYQANDQRLDRIYTTPGAVLLDLTYNYDDKGNVKQIVDAVEAKTSNLQYDARTGYTGFGVWED